MVSEVSGSGFSEKIREVPNPVSFLFMDRFQNGLHFLLSVFDEESIGENRFEIGS